MAGVVRTESKGEILNVTLDRPKANAIDVATSLALYEAFQQLEADSPLRVGILTGAGDRFFCAGWDLEAGAGGEPVDADHGPGGFGGITEFLTRTKPIIAALNGLALGGGLEIALAVDLIVAAEHVDVGLPEVRLGLAADARGLFRLPRRVPEAIVREMLLTGRHMSAQEAERWGLVSRAVPGADPLSTSCDLAADRCSGGPLAIAAIREVLAATAPLGVQDAYQLMRSGRLPSYNAMLTSDDATEGQRAFAERRQPRWIGR